MSEHLWDTYCMILNNSRILFCNGVPVRITRWFTFSLHNSWNNSLLSFFKACPSSTIRHSHSKFRRKETVVRAVPYPLITTCALRSVTALRRVNSYGFSSAESWEDVRQYREHHLFPARLRLVTREPTSETLVSNFRSLNSVQ
jgi:hypothetical protein